MKKIFYLLILMFISNVNAQNFEYLKKIESLDFEQTKEITNDIISEMRNEYQIFEHRIINNFLVFFVIEKGIDIKSFKKDNSKYKDKYFMVYFKEFYEGENIPLEIKGVKRYSLNLVIHNYLDLFPYWNKYFNKNATLEKTINDYSMRFIDVDNKSLDGYLEIPSYSFNEYDGKKWQIQKLY